MAFAGADARREGVSGRLCIIEMCSVSMAHCSRTDYLADRRRSAAQIGIVFKSGDTA